MKLLLPQVSGFLLLSVLAFGCAAPTASSEGLTEEEAELLDPEVTQELQGRPSYTVASVAVRGSYAGDDGCAGGFTVCHRATVSREDGRTKVWLGDEYGFEADTVWSKNGVILFSAESPDTDCDDPGCGDIVHVSGVIYPVKAGETWAPQVKLTFQMEFWHPESEDDRYGELTEIVRLHKDAIRTP